MIRSVTEAAIPPSSSAQQSRSPNALGQQDFLTLLTTQLRNQDPLNPMQNTEFLGQMAQFSTVSGIERLDASVQALGDGFRDLRLGMASQMVGQSALVPGSVAMPDRGGVYRGAVNLDHPVSELEITFTNAQTGALVHRQIYGAQSSGQMDFIWDSAPTELLADRQALRVTVTAFAGDEEITVSPISVYAQVQSVTVGNRPQDLIFDIEGYGQMLGLEIETIR